MSSALASEATAAKPIFEVTLAPPRVTGRNPA